MERNPEPKYLVIDLILGHEMFSLPGGKTSKVATCLVCSHEALYVDDKEEERVQPMLGVV